MEKSRRGKRRIKADKFKENEKAEILIEPTASFDIGEGPKKPLTETVSGGSVGIIIDARGRPISIPEDKTERRNRLNQWFKAMELYPEKP